MHIRIRLVGPADADVCGRICYEGFKALNERHGFPPNFPSAEVATGRIRAFIEHPAIFGVVAEAGGTIVGFNFLSERDPVCAVGPIVIDPAVQSHGIGRRLMQSVLDRAKHARSIRLTQASFNMQSLSLYAALGFEIKELLIALEGSPNSMPLLDWEIRPLEEGDIADCEALHKRLHGFTRTNELRDVLATGSPIAALQNGHVRAYMTTPTFWIANHGVAETEEDMKALIVGAWQIVREPLSFLLPARRAELFRWCLAQGFRATMPMTLMALGEYREPKGSYLPSVLY